MNQLAFKVNTAVTVNGNLIDVFHWHSRHVVFDPSIQPRNISFVFLYFVQGRALCTRRKNELNGLPVRNPDDKEYAIQQYLKWQSYHPGEVDKKLLQTTFASEDPPAPRMKCPVCDGSPAWVDAIVKPTYGVKSEGANIVERCACGDGWVKNDYGTR